MQGSVLVSMLEFSALTLGNAFELKPYLTHSFSRLCDYVYGTVLLWRDMWPLEFAFYDDIAFMRVDVYDGAVGYMLPVGGDLERALDILDSCVPENKLFFNVPGPEVDFLRQRYGDISVKSIGSGGDYLYDAESMAALSGRKLHGQRNHANYFERTWEYRFEEITSSNVCDVKAFIESKPVTASSEIFTEGNRKTLELLDNLSIYDFSSLTLYAGDKVVGFTFGTLLGDTLYVTIEQADRDYRGAYPMLASKFVSDHLDAGAGFVNREDDLDNEGLRRSKQAWNPCEIVGRFSVTIG